MKLKNKLSLIIHLQLICFGLIGSCLSPLAAQNFEWAKQIGGQGIDSRGIVTDKAGNIYTTGNFWGAIDFNPGSGAFNLNSTYDGLFGSNGFVSKLDASGGFLWTKQQGTYSGRVYPIGISLDPSGNIYTTGKFAGTADFNPGTGPADTCWLTPYFTRPGRHSISNIFISKLDSNGAFGWVKQIGDTNGDSARRYYQTEAISIATDGAGNIYIAGKYKGDHFIDFNPGAGVVTLPWASAWDPLNSTYPYYNIFILKLDPDGNFVWVKGIGDLLEDMPLSIAVDFEGNVYATGYFEGILDFNPGKAVYNLTATAQHDAFIVKLNGDGNFMWAKQIGGYGPDEGNVITLDDSGNVYTVGTFVGAIDFDPGPDSAILTSVSSSDVFVLKLNSSGNFIWAKNLGKNGGIVLPVGATTDTSGSVYISGTFIGTMDFDPGANHFNMTSAGAQDVFVTKLYASGDFAWARQMGGIANDFSGGVAIDDSRNIYTTGNFYETADFNPGGGSFKLTADSMTLNGDMFVHKMSPCFAPADLSITACKAYIIGKQTFMESGIYKVTMRSATGCDSIISLDLTINTVDASLAYQDNVLTATETGATYQWIECGNKIRLIPGATEQQFIATKPGNYAVVVSKDDCTDTSDCYSISPTDIDEINASGLANIYPNPGNGIFNVRLNHRINHASVKLINIVGQTVLRKADFSGTAFSFNLGQCPSGIYIIEINEGTRYIRTKLVKK